MASQHTSCGVCTSDAVVCCCAVCRCACAAACAGRVQRPTGRHLCGWQAGGRGTAAWQQGAGGAWLRHSHCEGPRGQQPGEARGQGWHFSPCGHVVLLGLYAQRASSIVKRCVQRAVWCSRHWMNCTTADSASNHTFFCLSVCFCFCCCCCLVCCLHVPHRTTASWP
jgi:hypothetical protein